MRDLICRFSPYKSSSLCLFITIFFLSSSRNTRVRISFRGYRNVEQTKGLSKYVGFKWREGEYKDKCEDDEAATSYSLMAQLCSI